MKKLDKKNELISVVMGIYNIESKKVLKQAIDSILNQTYKNIEFIIVDDGSTNDTYKWAKELTENDTRVKIIKNEKNLGLTKTLNIGLKATTGKYIARMDGDDYCSLDRLEKQHNFLKKHEEYGLVSSNMYNFDEKGIWGERINNEIITKKDFLFTSPIPHPTILTYKKCFDVVNGYRESKDTDRNEDYDLFMRMFAKGIKMYTMQEKLYYYREDKNCYRKRKYRYRFCELIVRARGFKELKLYPKAFPYVVKPLIVGLIPQKVLRNIRKKQRG